MDDRSGRIYSEEDLKNLLGEDFKNSKEFQTHFIPVNENEMTEKQREKRKVSLQDYRSYLGKKRIQSRKKNKVGRNDFCPCGSGLKYKKCCLKPKK